MATGRVEVAGATPGLARITREPIPREGGQIEVGTKVVYHTEPPKEISIFDKSVVIKSPPNRNTVVGNTSFRFDGRTLLVDLTHEQGSSQVLVTPQGDILTGQSSESTVPARITDILTQKRVRIDQKTDYEKLYAGVTIEDPRSFDHLSLGQTLRWFRLKENFTQKQIADATFVHISKIRRLENDQLKIPRSYVFIHAIFDWPEDDPRELILHEVYLREREKQRLADAARRS